MQKYGFVKTLRDGENEIKLCGNARTLTLYKSYFGRDLFNDIVAFAKKNSSPGMLEKIQGLNVENITDDQAMKLYETLDEFHFDTEFITNFIVALMATALYPEKMSKDDLIDFIPPHFLTDQELIGEVLEFLSLFVKQKR
jgi:hypothetical protein